jgi:predicted AlkP superfamily phosphohydrolase/phosphomutase
VTLREVCVRSSWFLLFVFVLLLCLPTGAQQTASAGANGQTKTDSTKTPRVLVIGVNGAEWDIIRPLILRGEMPNLANMMENGISGKLQTTSDPNCPKVYSSIFTSTSDSENGISGFEVNGVTARSDYLKGTPFWSALSDKGITVGMANVPGTFPVRAVNGYMVSGMLTQGKDCDGILCSPKLSEVVHGEPVYPKEMKSELMKKVGDFWIDCSAMPTSEELAGNEKEVIEKWLDRVSEIRDKQTQLFEYLLDHHPTDFTMFAQSCEDRTGHWLYPIRPNNVGYNPKVHEVRVDAFPNQYRAFDNVLGKILSHFDKNTTVFVISDHGIKPLRDPGPFSPHGSHNHISSPIIAHHDFIDGDDVPGIFVATGPRIRHGERIMGLQMNVLDIAPTVLSIYGVSIPTQMKGRVLTEIFEDDAKAKQQLTKADNF